MEPVVRTLVTGGTRSGKSRYAEQLLAGAPAVTYVAPGQPADPAVDPEWAARIAEHRLRRPAHWVTVETTDVAAALRSAETPVLVDCLGTWLTALLDGLDAWAAPRTGWQAAVGERFAELIDAWRGCPQAAVAVTNEVGWGVVSEHRSGRLFADLLGRLNAEVAAASDEVVLMVAGRPLKI